MQGIQDFRPKNYDLKRIPIKVLGPIIYLNLHGEGVGAGVGAGAGEGEGADAFQLLQDRMVEHGYVGDFSDLVHVATKHFELHCNWKVFIDNYGDGCYHCSFAHKDLVGNIDETGYYTEVASPKLSIQYAPPAKDNVLDSLDRVPPYVSTRSRFGSRQALYAHMYASRALQFHPHGGQSDFVWLLARTPHVGAFSTCGEPDETKEKYPPPEMYYRSFP